MILGHDDLKLNIIGGGIICDPLTPENIGTNSIDVTLGKELWRVLPNAYRINDEGEGVNLIDMRYPAKLTKVPMHNGEWIIYPGELYLGHTVEVIGSDHYVPVMHGRSTPARSGVSPIVSAGYGDVGFIGQWVLEITTVAHPLILEPGMRIAQIEFSYITSNEVKYGKERDGNYKGQLGVMPGKAGNI